MLKMPSNPFSYDLGVKAIFNKTQPQELTICCHGYGHNNTIVDAINSYQSIPGHLVGFNFPDYNITSETNHNKSSFGSINEVLPLLYLINYYACDLNIPKINLYGFSAGGGAIINALAVLNKNIYQKELNKVGILQDNIKKIISALEKGQIILDCPLRSVSEIITLRGSSPELEIMAKHYDQNKMIPIDNIKLLTGLNLNITLYFENPDDVLGNVDDKEFVSELKKANQGQTTITSGYDGGHNTYHTKLWESIQNK